MAKRVKPEIVADPVEEPVAAEETLTQAEVIQRAIKRLEKKLGSNELKGTVGDFIRLLQLQKELGLDQPRQVIVSWVETNKTELDNAE